MNVAYAAQTVGKEALKGGLKVGMKLDAWDLVLNAGMLVKFVLLMLLAFSIVSWAIILTKHLQLRRIYSSNASFLELFWKATSLDKIFDELDHFHSSPLAQVFR